MARRKLKTILFAVLVISLFLLPGLTQAVTLYMDTDKQEYNDGENVVVFDIAIDLDSYESVPFKYINLIISGPEERTCKFSIMGNKLEDCPGITISASGYGGRGPGYGYGYASDDFLPFNFGYGYGYGYGYLAGEGYVNHMETIFDVFGYGYGYGYGFEGFDGELKYIVRWDASDALNGEYTATFEAYAEGDPDEEFRFYLERLVRYFSGFTQGFEEFESSSDVALYEFTYMLEKPITFIIERSTGDGGTGTGGAGGGGGGGAGAFNPSEGDDEDENSGSNLGDTNSGGNNDNTGSSNSGNNLFNPSGGNSDGFIPSDQEPVDDQPPSDDDGGLLNAITGLVTGLGDNANRGLALFLLLLLGLGVWQVSGWWKKP